MPKKQLPRFVIYQPNIKEFHICMEAGRIYYRWCSYYPPTPDPRFARTVTRIDNVSAGKLARKHIFDEGTYQVTKTDTKALAEQKLTEGIEKKTFAFILNGRKMKGRFAFKQVAGGTVLQKYKDKYATEEDVTFKDLTRTIRTMIPDYDEKKVVLPAAPKKKKTAAIKRPVVIKPTADKRIGNTDYHFTFYHAGKAPAICIVTDSAGAVLVLRQENAHWVLLKPVKSSALKNEKAFIEHATSYYEVKAK